MSKGQAGAGLSQTVDGTPLRHNPEVLELQVDGRIAVIDQRHGAVHEFDAPAALAWALLDEPSGPDELAGKIARLTNSPSSRILDDLLPLLKSWRTSGLVIGLDDSAAPPLRGLWPDIPRPGAIPVEKNSCTLKLDSLGWDAVVEVDIGDERTVGLRTSGAAALESVMTALPHARVRNVGDIPANVSFRVTEGGGTEERLVALAYQACTLVGRSRHLEEALASALRAVADEARVGPQHSETSVLLESTALLGPRGGVLIGPAHARHWMAGRSSLLQERDVHLLPRWLRVVPECRVQVESVELPGLMPEGVRGLSTFLEASGLLNVEEIHWANFAAQTDGGPLVGDRTGALAALVASAGPLTSDQAGLLNELVHHAHLEVAGLDYPSMIDRAARL